ncbi:MAG: site-2 protease family protein [Clostridia bacterium]|nr:site-2 protease family protein [Clostridia bacterium]
MYILIAILVFGFLIFIHELGHYLAARAFHVKIYEFSIGMGPRLLSWTSKKTGIVYGLRVIPIGGFVSMEGELSPPDGQAEEQPFESVFGEQTSVGGQAGAGPLATKPAWQRLVVHVAGAAMNLFFGFLAAVILTCALTVGGTTVAKFVPVEGATVTSQEQGLAVGDTILKVGRERVHIADQLSYEIMHQGGTDEPIILTVLRDGEELEIPVVFPSVTEQGQSIGMYDFSVYAEEKTLGVVIKHSFFKSCYMVEMVWDSVIDLVTGRYGFEAVSGPVGTATVIADAAKQSFVTLFYLTALISVNLGVFNLLPLPALDGGHIFYTLLELITRRRLPEKVVTVLDTVGMFLLLGLMAVVMLKDIYMLF